MSSVDIPQSTSTVNVHLLVAGHLSLPGAATAQVLSPVLPGHETLNAPIHVFLLTHPGTGKQVLFDLGLRKDWENLAPSNADMLYESGIRIDRDVSEILTDGGVKLDSIDTIIWSHAHLDHTGDPSTFPPTTELLIGPGTKEMFFPPYPQRKDGIFVESDFAGRVVRQVSFEDTKLSIGGFRAFDFFGDGSFFLLDLPGHIMGHMAGLARTTSSTFVFMGADTCHHPAILRPSPGICASIPCPGSLLAAPVSKDLFPEPLSERMEPLLTIPPAGAPSAHTDHAQASKDIKGVAQYFDSNPDIFIVLAHDPTLDGVVQYFPENLNGWKEKGWKERTAWAFLEKGGKGWRFDVLE